MWNEDEPSGPDTWACQSWRPSTRRAYGKKLAKLAEYQEQAGTEAVAEVLAEFLAAKAEAGERQATLRGYIAAIRAVEDLEWIDPIVRSRHKRIAQAASKVGRQPYLALGGLCALLVGAVGSEDLEPVALVAVLCWVLWLRVGEVAPLRLGDVSVPCWLQFWNRKTGEEGWTQRPLSQWADQFRSALYAWGVSRGLRSDSVLFPAGVAELEHKFVEIVADTPWRRCRWHALRRGGSAACYARHPQLQFFMWWGRWNSTGTALRYAAALDDPAVISALQLPEGADLRGAVGVRSHLEIWHPNMFPGDSDCLLATAFQPLDWP